MQIEIYAFIVNETQELVPLPSGVVPITCEWIFRIKFLSIRTLENTKPDQWFRDFFQAFIIDYQEILCLVVKYTTIRVVLAITIARSWTLSYVKVNNAFLNGDLLEDVYLCQPLGFEASDATLKKALYGLKQASLAWF